MSTGYFITGTDTDVGKTLAAAWLALHLDGDYWKPVQCGGADQETVLELTGFDPDRVHQIAYDLKEPLSPHEAARREGVSIDMERFVLPRSTRKLVVEGAGGVMVPLTNEHFVIDLIARLGLPALLVCRSGLGTINHTLLSLEALRARGIEVAGLIINGPKTPHNRRALEQYGHAQIVAEIDRLDPPSRDALLAIKPEAEL